MLRDEQSGFDAAIYRNDQGQYVVAFRGTGQCSGRKERTSKPMADKPWG